MTAQILVVDDEPDLEALIQQKFRHQIRDGAVAFVFARDGVDALQVLKANGAIDMGRQRAVLKPLQSLPPSGMPFDASIKKSLGLIFAA